ncbi:CocE/NonD family hydrolase [Lutibaculum baratangense]|uniref:Xaa-Pro dipeptidyl-peptidase C-terminal domain-containing protein n=1 Tax=Lutibaculum baratangense AMV1 TaxID=631454 RepID=V4RGS4_9HYPH|nr:CocE/NonD family hydrolase [Lutibaculum baratangense]ESR24559.1 hypothetical protein N177_2393 [Lutibaculum baratangense AMV1]
MTNRGFSVVENEWISLSDGSRLAARIFMPDAAAAEPVPAIFEFVPYRKGDGTRQRDDTYFPAFAAAGYAGVRVDIRGSGESDGVIDGEYTPRELADACEVIDWIAAQPWCSGSVGMMGISWGGFNALQVAALRPAPLKAIISVASTVDRYDDDIHYKGGCHLGSNFAWAAAMASFQSRPPDPEIVGEAWREMWLDRLENEPFMLEEWLAHQRRDAFWKHGSVCEDFAAIEVPVLLVAGWADGYRNTPLKGLEGLLRDENGRQRHSKALIGSWAHRYPHLAWPGPAADFVEEAVRWWGRWLKRERTGAAALPAVRAHISHSPRHSPRRENDPGSWVGVKEWRQPELLNLHAGEHGSLVREQESWQPAEIHLNTPGDLGTAGGEYFTEETGVGIAGDQRYDDAASLTFESAPFDEPLALLGRPSLTLTLRTKDPQNLVARLVDVHPDGSATRVSLGVLNLAHRDGHEHPLDMPADEPVTVRLLLDACGYRFAAGNRLRLSLSNAYWPMVWPAPGTGGIRIEPQSIELSLPLLGEDATPVDVPPPPGPAEAQTPTEHRPPELRRTVERNLVDGRTTYRVFEDSGAREATETGPTTRLVRREIWTIDPDDPLSARAEAHWTAETSRGDWRIRTETFASLSCTAGDWIVSASVLAYEGDRRIHRKVWSRVIPRDHM